MCKLYNNYNLICALLQIATNCLNTLAICSKSGIIVSENNRAQQKKGKRKMYKVTKINIKTNEESNYGGGYTEEDVKLITKGYTYNGLFYERKNSNYIFIVEGE